MQFLPGLAGVKVRMHACCVMLDECHAWELEVCVRVTVLRQVV